MKKSLIVSLLLIALVATPVLAQDDSLSLRLEELRNAIARLQAWFGLTSEVKVSPVSLSSPRPVICHLFNQNLGVGAHGKDVTMLHEILAREGFVVKASEEIEVNDRGQGTHFFGEATAAAVVRFQAKYGILQTGFVGPITRAKLNALYGNCRPVPSPGNQSPVIYGVSGPTALEVGAKGTWTIRASDPENGRLSYTVDWGDRADVMVKSEAAGTQAAVQTATFTHVYASAGLYHAVFTVTDEAGLSVRTAYSVRVGRVNVSEPTVLSPNGGERWVLRSVEPLRWSFRGRPEANTKVDLYLDLTPGPITCGNVPIPLCDIEQVQYVLDKNINWNASYRWIVGTDINGRTIPAGNYRLRVCLAGTSVCDSSNGAFTIVGATVPGNLSPVINGISGPTTLDVGVAGVWTVRASDPENGPLTYSVDWGDQSVLTEKMGTLGSFFFPQAATFSHVYAAAGVYTATFIITDNVGLSARTSMSVEVR